MPISRLSGVRDETSAPSTRMRPEVGVSKPAIIRRVVVLPQPDGPSSVTNDPPASDSDTSSTATTGRPSGERNTFVSRSSSTLAGVEVLPVTSNAPRQPLPGPPSSVAPRGWSNR